MSFETKEFAFKAVRLLNEKKAEDLTLLKIGKVSIIADYFLICNGSTVIQTKMLCDHLLENLPEDDFQLLRVEGYRQGRWILLDFGALIIHIFVPEEREFYNLERLWGNAHKVDVGFLSTSL
ncbi:MAG: ribosome silencing factor [Firmicutes bacterium]|nr:ribosome silencing factor [Bacillota bacterium]